MKNQPNKGTVKDVLPTAKKVLAKHYDVDNRVDEAAIVYAMQSYSDQQNAELRERVKELEGLLAIWVKQNNYLRRHSISDFDGIHGQTKKALKK